MKKIKVSIIVALIMIIAVGFGGVKIVKANKVNSSIELGNQYIAEENYKEAIIEFEKAIKIDDKNIEVKETLDILYVYEEIDELVQAGDLTAAQEKLEQIKDMAKFDILKDKIEELEEIVTKTQLGSSFHNITQGGLVAYDDEYVYYDSKFGINNGIVKRNLKTGDEVKIADSARYISDINVYEGYLYYIANESYKSQVVKVKTDGSEKEVLDSKSIPETGPILEECYDRLQIINGIVYYTISYYKESQSKFVSDLTKINLSNGNKEVVTELDMRWPIFMLNKDNTIDIYFSRSHSGSVIARYKISDIEGKSRDLKNASIEKSNLEIPLGYNNKGIYYPYYNDGKVVIREDLFDGNIKDISITYEASPAFIVGENKIYYIDYPFMSNENTKKLYELDLVSKENKLVKRVDARVQLAERDMSGNKLFEVNGYLAYYNMAGELIIDKEININSSNDELIKEDSLIEENETVDTPIEDIKLKEEYLDKLDSLEKVEDQSYIDKIYGAPSVDLPAIAKECYENWDDALNEIWGILLENLPKEQMDILTEEQIKWIENKEREANEQWDNRMEGMGSNFVLQYINESLAEKTRERCYELVNKYMK